MKKKFAAILCTFVLLLACLCLPAFAAGKPNVELMYLEAIWEDNRVYSPTLWFRNNSNKTVKYLDWYVTAYNAVDDKVTDNVLGATQKLTVVGPMEPSAVGRDFDSEWKVQPKVPEESPFRRYRETGYSVAIDDDFRSVYQDEYNNFFVWPSGNALEECVYLSNDEIAHAMFSCYCNFDRAGWYSRTVDYLRVDKLVVTYMDGTTETLTNVGSKYRDMSLQNPPFVQQLAQYQAVYNYQDYLNCNPDLATQFGANQKALFEHFVTQGMKEGRQGSAEFNLNAYKANNPDLVAMFGDDNVKYYEHFISSGRAEGRVAI